MKSLEKELALNPQAERMPKNRVFPDFDIQLVKPIAVLKYIYNIKTQWSCQGNHSNELGRAYLMLEPDNTFPDSLLKKCHENNIYLDLSDEYIVKNGSTTASGKKRYSIRPTNDMVWGTFKSSLVENYQEYNEQVKNSPKLSHSEKTKLNDVFLKVLNDWADFELKKIKLL